MKEEILIGALKKQTKAKLISLLIDSYQVLSSAKRHQVFGEVYNKEEVPIYDSRQILKMIRKFYNDSLAKKYYAPFMMNSKNFSDIPEETELWCDLLADYFKMTLAVFEHEEYDVAVKCFDMLFYLQNNMCEEIVFAHELGTWMIPIKQSLIIPKYIEAMAKSKSPDEYRKGVKMLMAIDDYEYKRTKVYNKAIRAGTPEQRRLIKELQPNDRRRTATRGGRRKQTR